MSSPKTTKCVQALRKKRRAQSANATDNNKQATTHPAKIRRLSNLEVSEFITRNNIKNEDELYAVAFTQKEQGKKDLANFVVSRSQKSLSDLFESTRRIERANAIVQRARMNRMDLIDNALKEDNCVCGGEWFTCANQVLVRNGIHPFVFADRVRSLLIKGRGKLRNLIIVGPANCGKICLLRPIENIFKTFCNPANDKYGWVGADKAEAIFLNDFRWTSELIQWNAFLLMLEGHTVHLPAPKNHFASDVCIDKDTPIFATSKEPIRFVGRYNATDERENEMMAVRWHVFTFTQQIDTDKQKDVPPCSKCFAKLIKFGA